jgi:hypothetical protein
MSISFESADVMTCTDAFESTCKAVMEGVQSELHEFLQMSQEDVFHGASLVREYKCILWDYMPQDERSLQALQTRLHALLTHDLAQNMLQTQKALSSSIEAKQVDVKRIQETFQEVKEDFIAKTLMHMLAYGDDAEEASSLLFNFTASKGLTHVLKVFIENDLISAKDQAIALKVAAKNGDLEVIKVLFTKDNLTDAQINEALIAAEEGNQQDAFAMLLKKIELTQDQRGRLALLATSNNHLNILNLLFEDGTICDLDRGRSTLIASSKGFLELVAALLQNGPITEDDKNWSIRAASGVDRDGIVDLLQNAQLCEDDNVWFLSFDEVAKDPLSFLSKINTEGFPQRIELQTSEGEHTGVIDHRGVRKVFISALFQHLQSHLHLDSHQLPVIDHQNAAGAQMENLYENLGRFFSILYEQNHEEHDPFLIGSVFHEKFFEILQIVAQEPQEHMQKIKLCYVLQAINPNYEFLTQFFVSPENEQYRQMFADIVGCEPEKALNEAHEMLESYLKPARKVFLGSSESFINSLSSCGYSEIAESIQGQGITKQALKRALFLEEPSEKLQERYVWIQEQIDQADLSWSQRFVEWVTGKKSLSSSEKITLNLTNHMLMAHVCTNSVDLPEDFSKEDLLVAMEFAFGGALNSA